MMRQKLIVPINSSPLQDPVLCTIASEIAPLSWISTENVFHDLMSCIIEQQIHYRSSKKVFFHVMQSAGLKELTTENFEILEPALPTVKLSAAKYEAMARTLDYFKQNSINWHTLSDEEVRKALSVIPGIGRWTVDMILLFTLKRADIFPYDDYHLKKVMAAVYGLPDDSKREKKMIQIAESWSGNRSIAVLYLLAWKNHQLKR